ncbi:U6 snRNA phosphodiesterase 1 [Daktulosphaira vitifoliae]|uniref:U6 snRNA phosphodiesterase 1 n=1 Tax=Daktulosphaira vitifoliae TaxID=58002 RepID=UPI0021AB02F5|nr:U6 snRNA phosphodiesterase 1 [Daktulosphaira vitifoliae]
MDLIQNYGESDDEQDNVQAKLPIPNTIISMFDGQQFHPKPTNNPTAHQGRTRLFEHERGNWATYIYIPCPEMELVEIVQEKLSECGLEIIGNPHVSLTRTIILQFHWINQFINDIKSNLKSIEKFTISLGKLEVFCNDNCSRTFVGFIAQPQDLLLQCVQQLDKVLLGYDLPIYYKNPKFHLSVAWCLGDQSSSLQTKLKSLVFEFDVCSMLRVEKLICKTGNKNYSFDLV